VRGAVEVVGRQPRQKEALNPCTRGERWGGLGKGQGGSPVGPRTCLMRISVLAFPSRAASEDSKLHEEACKAPKQECCVTITRSGDPCERGVNGHTANVDGGLLRVAEASLLHKSPAWPAGRHANRSGLGASIKECDEVRWSIRDP